MFLQLWKEEGRNLITKLSNKELSPLSLETIKWQLHLQVGQNTLSQMKEPLAIFELGLKPDNSVFDPFHFLYAFLIILGK